MNDNRIQHHIDEAGKVFTFNEEKKWYLTGFYETTDGAVVYRYSHKLRNA